MTGLRVLPQPMRRFSLLIAGIAVLLLVAGLAAWRLVPPVQAQPKIPVPKFSGEQSLEQIYGVRITLVGMTADGAMLDFRFQVLDTGKAYNMLADTTIIPLLVSERTHKSAQIVNQMQPRHDLKVGAVYSLLFYNSGGAIEKGDQVTVMMGQVKVEHQVAQ